MSTMRDVWATWATLHAVRLLARVARYVPILTEYRSTRTPTRRCALYPRGRLRPLVKGTFGETDR
jgi:hypothetical protein